MSDPFERRLAGALQAYADARTRPVDASALARAVIATRRPLGGWAAVPRLVRAGLLVAAAMATLLAMGLALGVGSDHRPLADGSPAVGPTGPTPVATTFLALRGSVGWGLDWAASGLTAPTLNEDPKVTLGSRLTFTSNAAEVSQGFGGGCEVAVGPYEVNGRHLAIHIEDTASSCGVPEATTVKHRITQAASYWLGRETCASAASDQPVFPSDLGCRTLKLFDANGALLLVYRGYDDVPPGLRTPDPTLAQLSANRWQLDWAASGLDGNVITTVADPMTSVLIIDPAGSFTIWQGYAGGCDNFAGIVHVQQDGYLRLEFDQATSRCAGAGPQAVLDRLKLASGFFLHLADCSTPEPPSRNPGGCLTLQLDSATGNEYLIYRAVP